MKKTTLANILTLIIMIAVNGLANTLPLNGQTTGEVSDSFPVLFTPAGYVFAIWGLIYLLLIAFTIYQALPSQQNNPRLDRIGYWFAFGNLMNTAWIFFWHYNLFPLTEVAMLGLLASLLVIYNRLGIGREALSLREKWLVALPFSVYLGWISVATIANTSVVLYNLGWNGEPLGPAFWAVLVILVATGLGAAMILLRGEIAYPLVLIWAFVGIFQKQAATPSVAYTAVAAAAAVAVLLAVRLLQRKVTTARIQPV